MKFRAVCLGICVLALCSACSKPPKKEAVGKDYYKQLPPGEMALRKITDPAMIPYFGDALRDRESLLAAIDYSLDYFHHPSSKNYFPYLDISHERAVESLIAFKEVIGAATTGQQLQQMILDRFDVYQSVGCDNMGTMLFTGYFTPIYDASLVQTAVYRYPIYKMPPDLEKGPEGRILGRRLPGGGLAPYYTREEIMNGRVLDGKGLELAWLKTPVKAYNVTIQGSAILKLPDGSEFRVGYAANNGHDYKSLGEMLVNDGKITRAQWSAKGIEDYLEAHPQDTEKYLCRNPRYVFFRPTAGDPTGSLGQPVTAYRSLATDKAIFPRGCLAYIETLVPQHRGGGIVQEPFKQFMLDQDTGGAIRTPGRADIYMGIGPKAGELAGGTKEEGRMFYLFVKEEASRPISMLLQR